MEASNYLVIIYISTKTGTVLLIGPIQQKTYSAKINRSLLMDNNMPVQFNLSLFSWKFSVLDKIALGMQAKIYTIPSCQFRRDRKRQCFYKLLFLLQQ